MSETKNLFKKFAILSLFFIFSFFLSATSNAQTCPDDMTHYWKLDETGSPTEFFDSYDTNDATCDTDCPAPVFGILDGAQQFDGIADEVNVTDDDTFDWAANASFSIEYWIKKDNVCSGSTGADNEVIVGRDDGSLHWWTGIDCVNGGKAIFVLTDNDTIGEDNAWVGGTTILTDGEWYHIVAVRDASGAGEISIYVNGIKEVSAPASYSAGFDSSTELNIGHLNNNYRYDGILDEVALYDRALSETEIKTHYYLARGYCNACSTLVNIMALGDSITSGIASGAEPEGENLLDSQYHISYRKDLWESLNNAGYDVDFVGNLISGDFYPIDPDHEGHDGMTDEWMAENIYDGLPGQATGDNILGSQEYPPDVILLHIGTNYPNIYADDVESILDEIDQYEADSGTTITVVLARIINQLCCSDTPACSQCATTTDFNANLAIMAEARIANGDKIIIVDMEYSIDYAEQPDGDMYGNWHPYETGYKKMADVWYGALASFLPACTPISPTIISTPLTEATVDLPYTYDVDATGYPAPTYALTTNPSGMGINTTTGEITWTPAAAQTGPNQVVVAASNGVSPDDTQSFTINVVDASSCPPDISHYWMLEETSPPYQDSILTDKNDAICGTDCPVSITGQVGSAQQFNGINDEVNVADDDTFDWAGDVSFSIEYWIKKDNVCSGSEPNDNEVIVGRDDGSLHWWAGINCMDDGKAIFVLTDNDTIGDDNAWVGGSTILTDGEWYHIVAVRDASGAGEISIYVNGIKEVWAPARYSSGFDSSTELNIGHLNNNYRYDGILDEVALWNKALTIAEIEAHYDAGRLNGLGYCDDTAECQVDEDCDDDLYCNGEETCDENNVCQPGTPPDCDDGVDCTDDSCDPGTDSCLNEPDDDYCDDGLYCNGDEICDVESKSCLSGGDPCPDDGLFCNGDEICDEDNDICTQTEEPCMYCYDDGCTCNEDDDLCSGGSESDYDGDGIINDEDNCPKSDLEETIIIGGCDTGVDNYLFENCGDEMNACANTKNPFDVCCTGQDDDEDDRDDNSFCNGEEFCGCTMKDLITDCADNARNHGKFVSCVSHLTKDWKKRRLIRRKEKGAIIRCAAKSDLPSTSSTTTTTVVPPPIECVSNLDCDDELYCNGFETCDENKCLAGINPCPDDGLFCNGVESCDDEMDTCLFSGNPCEPNLICDEEINSCLECLEDADCDDGLYCNGSEECVDGICQPGDNLCPEDTVCNEETDACETTTTTSVSPGPGPVPPTTTTTIPPECENDEDCDDEEFCNGTETCVEGVCQLGIEPCLDDELFCNGDELCDEDNDICIHTGNPCREWETCNELTDACLSESPSPTIELVPDSAWCSQTIPFPLIMLIIGHDTHFNETTTIDFNNDLVWPPVYFVLSPTNIFVFSVIKPVNMGTTSDIKVTVSTETSPGTIEEITESLTLRKISWFMKE